MALVLHQEYMRSWLHATMYYANHEYLPFY